MRLLQRTATAALVAAGFALGATTNLTSVHAAPAAASAASSRTLSPNSDIVQVRERRRGEYRRRGGDWNGSRNYRRYRDYDNDGWGNSGAYIGLGIAGALIGGAIAEGAYDDGPGYSEGTGYGGGSSGAMQRCAAQFRSFEWETGLYTTYGGERRLCPYLG